MNIKYLSSRSRNVTCSRRKIWFWLQGTLDRPSKVKSLNKRHARTRQLFEYFLCLLVRDQHGKAVQFTIFLRGLRLKEKGFSSPWEKITELQRRNFKSSEEAGWRYYFIIFTNNGKNDFPCTGCAIVHVVWLGNYNSLAFSLWITTLTSDDTL